MDNYFQIKNFTDIETFIKKTNDLHDGYIIAVEYQNKGIKICGDTYEFNPKLKQLKIRVLITSIQDSILEMVFENVLEWKITEVDDDILEAGITFDDKGFVIWTNDAYEMENFEGNDSYVIAEKMKWRFV